MTKEQFIKKDSDVYFQDMCEKVEHASVYHQKTQGYRNGLSKGLEIAEGFAVWLPNNRWKHTIVKCVKLTTSQLLEIYLNEINETK